LNHLDDTVGIKEFDGRDVIGGGESGAKADVSMELAIIVFGRIGFRAGDIEGNRGIKDDGGRGEAFF